MKIEKLTLGDGSERSAHDVADMIDIRYHPIVAKVDVIDDLHAEVSAADEWMDMVRTDIEAFCPDATFENVGKWQEN